jgi:tRNA 5-methylaminomethyl-2-thiouridine biosynthesis bifunctional protein
MLGMGAGAAAHFVATLAAWKTDPQRSLHLHYLAIIDLASLDVVSLGPATDPVPASLRAHWPLALPGLHRIALEQGSVTLDLIFGAPDACLAQVDARIDAFWLDDVDESAAAAPTCSATRLARLAAPGATLAANAAQTPALAAAGFVFKELAGVDAGWAQAIFAGRQPRPARPSWQPPAQSGSRHAIVIGAGLAGACACERLTARGWQVTLIERHPQPAQEASGNLAGIFMPQLSQDDNPATRLSRAAYLFALRQWDRLGVPVARCGVLQLARDPAHAQVQRKIAARWNHPPQFARWLEEDAASDLLGSPAPDGGWLFPQGGWAHPASVCQVMLDACGARLERLFSAEALHLERFDDQWHVFAGAGDQANGGDHAKGRVLASAPTLVLANGCGATAFAQAANLPLSAVRGQVTHLARGTLPELPLVVCRDAYMTPPSTPGAIVCVGATYDLDPGCALRPASQQANLHKIAALLGLPDVVEAPLAGRVGFRSVAPDRLPLVGALPDYTTGDHVLRIERLVDVPRWPGLHCLLGYASRGLIWAPLAAELLAAQLCGEPAPLESSLAQALDPGRFLLRAHRLGAPLGAPPRRAAGLSGATARNPAPQQGRAASTI